MDFFAIDFETANADRSSICQIGLATVVAGKVTQTSSVLVNPADHFDPINVSIHGIDDEDVVDAMLFPEAYNHFLGHIRGRILVSHTSFDRVALNRACQKHNIILPEVIWLDSSRMVRRAWPDQYRQKGYGLANVAKTLGIYFDHHDAGEDARAAAEIVIRVVEDTGFDLDWWLSRVKKSILPTPTPEITSEPNRDGPFFGSCIVFTGALQIPRREASSTAAHLGFSVARSVTGKTDFLVVGDQDATKLAGKDKSSKHIKAEEMIKNGFDLSILTESDFAALVNTQGN